MDIFSHKTVGFFRICVIIAKRLNCYIIKELYFLFYVCLRGDYCDRYAVDYHECQRLI